MNGCNNCAKRRDVQKECPWGGTYHHRGEHGERIGTCNAYRKETNADHIRAMSDEELAELLCVADWCDECDQVKEDGTCHAMGLGGPLNQYCVAAGLKWLQQPAPEEGEQNVRKTD